MRIALWHNLPPGGGKRAFHDQVIGLRARGHDIEIFTPPNSDGAFLPLPPEVPVHHVPLQLPRYPGTGLGVVGHATYPRRLRAAVARHAEDVAQLIRIGGFDLLLSHPCRLLRVTPLASLVDLPAVLYLQEPNRALYEASPDLIWAAPRPRAEESLLRYLRTSLFDIVTVHHARRDVRAEAEGARAYHRILVNSRFSRESVVRAYGVDAHVCYLGIDLERFKDRKQSRQYSVLGVGSFVAEKGIDLVIEAVAGLPSPRPRIDWVGVQVDRVHLAHLVDMARDRGVDFQTFIGIDDSALIELYATSGVLVYTPHLEPFGYVPLEAAACGLDVVAIAEGGIRETVSDGANGVLIEHPDELGPAIRAALSRWSQTPAAAKQHVVSPHWGLPSAADRLERHLIDVAHSYR